ncbi:MAG: glucokinase [Thermoanaerobaculum sp.]|nr:glucokinase [Thermoanaerobaculum sp.]MDW7967599.1 ROK family protein [Thermoanaerobaculum sp.]
MTAPVDPLPVLLGDVGATKTVLALGVLHQGQLRLCRETLQRLDSQAYPHVQHLVAQYLENLQGQLPQWACLGVPGPVVEGRCRTTNLPWELEASTLARSWQMEGVLLLNDVAALAWAFTEKPFPQEKTLRPGKPKANANRLVVAVGTGLGVAVVAPTPKGPQVLASEAGHCDFSAKTAEDWQLRCWLAREMAQVSYESVVSGEGLVRLFRYFARQEDNKGENLSSHGSAWVVHNAPADQACQQAVRTCARFLATFLGDLALVTLPLSGVHLGGSVAAGLAPYLASQEFFAALAAKAAHQEMLSQIPVYLVEDPVAPLWGCGRALARAFVTGSLPQSQ